MFHPPAMPPAGVAAHPVLALDPQPKQEIAMNVRHALVAVALTGFAGAAFAGAPQAASSAPTTKTAATAPAKKATRHLVRHAAKAKTDSKAAKADAKKS
jgi:hypothetical protein